MSTTAPRHGYSGLRMVSALGALAVLPALVGAAVAFQLRGASDAPELRAELEERRRAGELGLEAIEELRQAEARLRGALLAAEVDAAEARALRAVLDPEFQAEGLARARVDPSGRRLLEPLAGASSSTVAAAFPALAEAIAAKPSGAAIQRLPEAIVAIGPAQGDAPRLLALSPVRPTPSALSTRAGALVSLAAPLPPTAASSELLRFLAAGGGVLFAGALAGLLSLWLARRRFAAPLERTLDAVDGFTHGERSRRADEQLGGPEARALARAVNALMAEVERVQASVGPEIERDLRALVQALEGFGRGDLAALAGPKGSGLGPAFAAVTEARQATLARLGEIARSGHDVALGAQAVARGLHATLGSSKSSAEVVERLAGAAEDGAARVGAESRGLGAAIAELGQVSSDQKRIGLKLRADLTQVARKAADLAQVADQVDARATDTRALDEALDLLTSIAGAGETVAIRGIGGASVPSSQVILTARRSRAALEELRSALSGLSTLLTEVAHALATLGAQPVAVPGDLSGRAAAILSEHADTLVRSAESLIDGLRAIERNARAFSDGAIEILRGAERTEAAGGRLSLSLLAFDLGPGQDQALVDGLESAAREMKEGALSRDGQLAVAALARQAEEARARLGRMIAAAESSADLVRGSSRS